MSDPSTPEPAAISNRYELSERLRAETKLLEGVRQDHFVDQRSLCGTCKYAAIVRQASRNTRVMFCGHFGKVMPEDISECSVYQAINSLSLNQMVEIATIIDDRPDRYRGYL
jgi:hypothetical protein